MNCITEMNVHNLTTEAEQTELAEHVMTQSHLDKIYHTQQTKYKWGQY